MALIKSISGIRGTIGGEINNNLTPLDTVKFVTAYGMWIKQQSGKQRAKVVLGRDARISGPMLESIVCGTLSGLGIDVLNIGLASTPTVEIAVTHEKADGGIILTASHNPKQWNALKLLNHKGEFLNAQNGELILKHAQDEDFNYATVEELGTISTKDYTEQHIQDILKLQLVDIAAIEKANFKIAVDAVNSVGGVIIPKLLNALGVKEVVELYCTPDGHFPHNPEPLPENLTEISKTVVAQKADLGLVVDPDVDRLAIVNENGTMFGEEYTLVSVADYVLQNQNGNTASNLSSTRALRDVTEMRGGNYFSAAVGEVNVVAKMKEQNVVIGGEGNGGIIYPAYHYGRDALVGIALFLSQLAKSNMKCSELRATYPEYYISKNKIELTANINVDKILSEIELKYKQQNLSVLTIDGVKIEFDKEWVHLRKSNTEPIIRIYAESKTEEKAEALAQKIIDDIKRLI